MAALIKTLGTHAFATERTSLTQLRQRCEAWGKHVLRGAPFPGAPEGATDSNHRAWRELQQFVAEHRKDEVSFVDRHVVQVRDVMVELVHGLRDALAADTEIDSQIEGHLGALEQALTGNNVDEIQTLVPDIVREIRSAMMNRNRTVRHRLQELGSRLKSLREDLAETKKDAELDPLTRVYNRGAFSKAFERTCRLSIASGEPLTLLVVDLDRFKWVNDTYGHQAGDIVLCRVADCIIRSFPRSNDFVARYGGEEFAILLRDVDDKTAAILADRVLDRIRQLAIPVEHKAISVTASIGHARLDPNETARAFFQRADKALYQAKDGGRDRAVSAD